MSERQSEVTGLLLEWSAGDPDALDKLMPIVVAELRRIARSQFARETPGHTLQPTALVNELYLRLVGHRKVAWKNRAQFFGVAAKLMRRILVDHARRRRADKRGGGGQKIPLEALLVTLDGVADFPDTDLLALDEALSHLAAFDPRQARVVELRFFGGLTQEEVAEVLDISPTTVKDDWRLARLWLLRELRGPRH